MRLTNEMAIQNETGSSCRTNHVSTGLSGLLRSVRMPTSILPVAIPRQAYQPITTPITPKKIAGIIISGLRLSWRPLSFVGLLTCARYAPDLFFNIKFCERGFGPELGLRVSFDTADDPRSHKPMAVDVTSA